MIDSFPLAGGARPWRRPVSRRLLAVGGLLLALAACDVGGGTPTGLPLVVTTTELAQPQRDVPYVDLLLASGGSGAYRWELVDGALPAGMGLSGATGQVFGTPTRLETREFSVRVTSDDGQMASQRFTLTVRPLVLAPEASCQGAPPLAIASFADANIEENIRSALGIEREDELTCVLAGALEELDASFLGVRILTGIQNLSGLRVLRLRGNPLGAPGALSALSRLTGLTELELRDDALTDIGVLRGLTNLVALSLGDNPNLSNIAPLLENTGLGPGDAVDLTATAVRCADALQLRARGVLLSSDCP